MISVSPNGRWSAFNSKKGFIDFPGGNKKFTIRYDPKSGLYWSLTNPVLNKHKSPNPSLVRNAVALIASPDLIHWETKCILIYHPDTSRHGFQYLDWVFEGEDILAACRTAFDDGLGGAHNQHDSNLITFHRIHNFRDLELTDSTQDLNRVSWKD